ncbi:MAG TPA: hypothetical protein VGB07_01810, partial [Blastocatellia bacterium]
MRETTPSKRISAGICRFICLIAIGLTVAGCQQKPLDPAGVWRGSIKNKSGEEVEFTLEVKRDGDKLTGALVNGDDHTVSTSGSFEGNKLKLRYDFYDAELDATIDGDKL